MENEFEHIDLEERTYVSACIEFETDSDFYEGSKPLEFEIKKKVETKIVENFRERRSRNSLF